MWWFFYGLIMGAGIMSTVNWVQTGNKHVDWYVWIIGALALLLISLTIQHFFASRKEMEYKAAWMGVLMMGMPGIILAGITLWLLIVS